MLHTRTVLGTVFCTCFVCFVLYVFLVVLFFVGVVVCLLFLLLFFVAGLSLFCLFLLLFTCLFSSSCWGCLSLFVF